MLLKFSTFSVNNSTLRSTPQLIYTKYVGMKDEINVDDMHKCIRLKDCQRLNELRSVKIKNLHT